MTALELYQAIGLCVLAKVAFDTTNTLMDVIADVGRARARFKMRVQ